MGPGDWSPPDGTEGCRICDPLAAAPVKFRRAGPLPKEKDGADDLCERVCEPHVVLVALVALRLEIVEPAPKEPIDCELRSDDFDCMLAVDMPATPGCRRWPRALEPSLRSVPAAVTRLSKRVLRLQKRRLYFN